MGASTPVSPTPRRIAFRQGLIFGGGVGIAALLFNMCLVFAPFGRFGLGFSLLSSLSGGNVLVYLLALIAFFFAGWRAAQQTGRVDIGGLAGFWAGLVSAVVLLVIDLALTLYSLTLGPGNFRGSQLVRLIFEVGFIAGRDTIFALLLGTALGALGGFIGRTYASSGPADAPQPNQPPPSPAAPPPPGQP